MNAPEEIPNEKGPVPSMTTQRKWLLFAAGFLGWYVVNGLTWFLLAGGKFLISGYGIPNLFLLPVNVIVLLILAIKRSTRPIGMGILAALAVNLLITLFLGIVENGLCFLPFFLR